MTNATCNRTPASFSESLRKAVTAVLHLLLLLAIAWRAKGFAGLSQATLHSTFVDFDAIRLAGQMALKGAIIQAYDIHTMYAAEMAAGGGAASSMPWAYPPQFDLIATALALLPRAAAYLLFMLPAFAVYMYALHRLARERLLETIVLVLPSLFFTILIGQNGLLTGALIGLFALITLKGGNLAGIPLGLMVIKPHLAVGLTVLTLARRRWSVIAIAAAVTIGTGALATLAFGLGVWPAFLSGARQTSALLGDGAFQMFRLSSVYAAAHSMGAPVGVAMAAQIATAVLAAGLVVYTVRSGWSAQLQLGMAVLCTLSVSPYIYDYDMPIFGVALALILPDLLARTSRLETAVFFALAAVSTVWSVALILTYGSGPAVLKQEQAGHVISISGLTYLAVIAFATVVLRRPQDANDAAPRANLVTI